MRGTQCQRYMRVAHELQMLSPTVHSINPIIKFFSVTYGNLTEFPINTMSDTSV
jgi:hypothetical protein